MATPTTVKKKKKVIKKPASSELPPTNLSNINLNAYIPEPEVAKNYVPRKIHGVWDKNIASRAREQNWNMLLSGETGSGKTLFGEAFASKNRVLYYSVPCDVSIDPSALFGKMHTTESAGVYRWQDGPVSQIVRGPCGKGSMCDDPKCPGGVLNFSEVNFMTPKIAASLYPLLDHRRYLPLLAHKGEIVGCHPRTLIIADMNPNYRGTMELNDAFKNRFAYKIRWGYDESVESKLVNLKSLKEIAGKLRAMVGTEIMTPISTNMLMEFETFALDETLGLKFAMGNFASAFKKSEQVAVEKILELNTTNLRKDLLASGGKGVDDEDEDDDSDVEELDDDDVIEFEFEVT